MKNSIVFLAILILGQLYSQKYIERIFSANDIETLLIDSNQITALTISSEKTDQIKVEMMVHGESASSTSLTSKITEKKLNLSTSFTPYFIPENDKLAAHKVLAIDVKITLPESINLAINLTHATLKCEGVISHFMISLTSGNCFLTKVLGSGEISTQDATVYITPNPDISVLVLSETSKFKEMKQDNALYTIKVITKKGDVIYQ